MFIEFENIGKKAKRKIKNGIEHWQSLQSNQKRERKREREST
jgi:hypothetical protein